MQEYDSEYLQSFNILFHHFNSTVEISVNSIYSVPSLNNFILFFIVPKHT